MAEAEKEAIKLAYSDFGIAPGKQRLFAFIVYLPQSRVDGCFMTHCAVRIYALARAWEKTGNRYRREREREREREKKRNNQQPCARVKVG